MHQHDVGSTTDQPDPVLSVVVVITGDTVSHRGGATDLAGCLEALVRQCNPPRMEIIVPYHSRIEGIEDLRTRFPSVHFQQVQGLDSLTERGGSREHHDELRARGATAARGSIIAFLEDHVCPDADWSARVVQAHRGSFAVVGGAIENGIDRPLNWAVYFCDLGKYQNPVREGTSTSASLVNASYKRAALESIHDVWRERFNETRVNAALLARGERLALSRWIVVRQRRNGLRLRLVAREFFIWGRSYARTRSDLIGGRKRALIALLAPLLPFLLLQRLIARVLWKGRAVGAFARAFPLTVLLTFAWSLGELVGYWSTGGGHSSASAVGQAPPTPPETSTVSRVR